MNDIKVLLLAAGLGTRLRPYTDNWPKCLMPIKGRPLLEYWLSLLVNSGLSNIVINLHYHADIVRKFLDSSIYTAYIQTIFESKLFGTAGTIRNNIELLQDHSVLVIHADNLCCCDFKSFIEYHLHSRPKDTVMTMMTFETTSPKSCGVVELNTIGIVEKFHEKVANPPSNLANAAVYLIEPEVLDWINEHPNVTDFSTEVLPNFIGRIATWKNEGVLRDIGTPESLKSAQLDVCENNLSPLSNASLDFTNDPIFQSIIENI